MSEGTRNWTRAVVVGLTVAIVLLGAILYVMQRGKPPIQIGALLSLSGPAGNAGQAVKNGMQLAVEELNAWGGIEGRKIELIIKDCGTTEDQLRSAFQDMEAAHHPLVYFTTTSRVAEFAAPLASEAKVVHVALVATAPDITKGHDWSYKLFTNPDNESTPILRILDGMPSAKHIQVFYLNDKYGQPVFDLLRSKLETNGHVVQGQGFGIDGALGPLPAGFKGVDAVYIVGYQSHALKIIPMIRQQGYAGPILLSNMADEAFVASNPSVEGAYSASPVLYDPDFALGAKVRKAYQERFNGPLGHFSANGYDAVKLLSGLMSSDVDLTRQGLRQQLDGGFTYPGVLGTFNASAGQHDIVFPLLPVRFVKGHIVFLRSADDR